METMNISLPNPLKQFVEGQISSGRYSSASEYVRELIRDDEKRAAKERLEMLLLEGLQGQATPFTSEDWQAIRQAALAKVQAQKTGPLMPILFTSPKAKDDLADQYV